MAESGTVFKNADQGSRLATANAKFALDLYQRQTAATTGNIFMSPLSISVALAMTYLGARGNTKTQMKDVMRFGEVEEEHLHQSFSDIRSALNKPDQPYTLYMANRLFGEKSYTFLQEFLSLGQQHYGAELAAVDFRNDAAGAVALINNWVAQNTNSKITELVPLSAVDNLTRLILVNAVYFKGDWNKKFDKQNTKDEDFHVSASEKVKVKLMHMAKAKLNYGYNNDLKSQAIELPYAGETLSMFIVLPDHTVTNLSELENKITVETLTHVRNTFRMSNREVHLWLPRFRLDEKLSLLETLTAMGMGDLFDMERVDLSGVDGKGNLVVSKVLHRAVVDVNEEGTEAAAATAVVMTLRCAMIPKDPFEFRADHPFLFFIQDNRTGSVLFLGRVVKPEAVSSKDEL